jgi:glucose-6-phosphate 1-dehydrogenase
MTVVTRTIPAHRIDGARPDDHVIVLFGATGDLAKRKLLPGLYHLFEAGLLPRRFKIIGTSRRPLGDDEFRALARQAAVDFGRLEPGPRWDEFAANLAYASSDVGAGEELAAAAKRAEDAIGGDVRRLHYLSVPPQAMAGIVETLGAAGLADGSRVIMEKPFGTDLESARALNAVVHGVFPEEQVFRIDHFLGKEAVQNVLALRFANGLFEPIWNRDHVDHVQLDVPETLSIGTRAGFYDATGAFRDMVVTHLFQVLGFAAMEPPVSLAAKPLVDEKVKVFESMRPLDPARVVRGRYAGYVDEEGVAPDSQTETFVALEAFIDNWRWAGVPFYLRTGKRLAVGRRRLTVVFREPPRSLFPGLGPREPNVLSFDLGEPGSITAGFLAKVPGASMELGSARFVFRYEESFATSKQLEAYERLIHDAMLGDRTLFTRADGIERLWEVCAPVLRSPGPVHDYEPGSWGPAAADELLRPRRWHGPDEAGA